MSGFFSKSVIQPTAEHAVYQCPAEYQTNVTAEDYYPVGCMVWGGLLSSWQLRAGLGSRARLAVDGFGLVAVQGVTLLPLGRTPLLA
jgi:hypothetical protein